MRLSTILRPSILLSAAAHGAFVAAAVFGTSRDGGGTREEPGLNLVALPMLEPDSALLEPEPPAGDVIPVELETADLPLETVTAEDDVPELEAAETLTVPAGLAADVPPIGVRVRAERAAPAASPAPPKSRTIVPPRRLSASRLPYPADAIANGWEGLAVFHVTVASDGRVASVSLESSTGYPVLDGAADTDIRAWLFTPALIDGLPSQVTVRVPIRFRL